MSRGTRKKSLKLVIVGADGRMGRLIGQLAQREGHSVLHKIGESRPWPSEGKSVDCVIEFSSPEGFRRALAWCLLHRKPLVAGTTGLGPKDLRALRRASKKIPILYSANMSLGVAVVRAMLGSLAGVRDWSFSMEEVHHARKKDKPSGTAKLLAGELREATGVERIPIRSVRRGRVPGIHQLEVHGPDETILLRHTAHDRRVFARGAIRAARWLFDKNRPGLYDLTDLYAAHI